jgi:hypothetical protein
MVKSGMIDKKGLRTAFVDKLPDCQFCKNKARYDGVVHGGRWAFMCYTHFASYGVGLGTSVGQRLATHEEVRDFVVTDSPDRKEYD